MCSFAFACNGSTVIQFFLEASFQLAPLGFQCLLLLFFRFALAFHGSLWLLFGVVSTVSLWLSLWLLGVSIVFLRWSLGLLGASIVLLRLSLWRLCFPIVLSLMFVPSSSFGFHSDSFGFPVLRLFSVLPPCVLLCAPWNLFPTVCSEFRRVSYSCQRVSFRVPFNWVHGSTGFL